MKLYYFKDPNGNFGDDLNPWLWDKLLPNFFDNDDKEIFVGIGTLINHRLPAEPIKHIFGSGFGYGTPPVIDDQYRVHAVRGYLTAERLGISKSLVITDAAILLRTIYKPAQKPEGRRIGFIPHCQSSRYFDWARVCEDLQLEYISAEWDVERVLSAISSCEAVVCEAMHGAIAADTLRVPWIPVVCYDYISRFKWEDWLSTLGISYKPHTITSLYDIERDSSSSVKAKNKIKRALQNTPFWSKNWTPPPPRKTSSEMYDKAIFDLKAALQGERYLSNPEVIESHTSRYMDLIDSILSNR